MLEEMQFFIDHHGYLSWLDLEVVDAEEGRVQTRIPYRRELTNPVGNHPIHGGVIATLIDTSSAMAIRSLFEDPGGDRMLTTTDMNVSYLRPATNDILADTEVVRMGGSTSVTRSTVSSTTPEDEEKEVAIGSTTYRLF